MTNASRRGQPLVALAAIMGGWIAVRAAVPTDGWFDVAVPPNVMRRVGEEAPVEPQRLAAVPEPAATQPPASAPLPRRGELADATPIVQSRSSMRVEPARDGARRNVQPSAPASPPAALSPSSPKEPMPKPSSQATRVATVPFSAAPAKADGGRWSGDAWLLWRDGSDDAARALAVPSYGASQAGAVLRYRIAPGSRVEPRAHLRVTGALDSDQQELAAGVGVRPITRLPVEILAEARVMQAGAETRLRPAVMAVVGPPPTALPLDLTGELYAQAGYIGGTDGTAFADGQMRMTRPAAIGPVRIEAGVAAWGGAQEGAARVDAGPTVSIVFPIAGGVFGRASLDWRQKLAGDADPGSGPVITLSAGF